MLQNFIVPCTLIHTVDCGIPNPPINGYLSSYPDTKEGTIVTFQCDADEYVPSVVLDSTCSNLGMWVPDPEQHECTLIVGKLHA